MTVSLLYHVHDEQSRRTFDVKVLSSFLLIWNSINVSYLVVYIIHWPPSSTMLRPIVHTEGYYTENHVLCVHVNMLNDTIMNTCNTNVSTFFIPIQIWNYGSYDRLYSWYKILIRARITMTTIYVTLLAHIMFLESIYTYVYHDNSDLTPLLTLHGLSNCKTRWVRLLCYYKKQYITHMFSVYTCNTYFVINLFI